MRGMKTNIKTNSNTVLILAILSMVVLGWTAVSNYLLFKDKELRVKAVEGCMNSATYEFVNKDTGVTTLEPKKDSYESCMEDKGY